jgi:hypothetical protein
MRMAGHDPSAIEVGSIHAGTPNSAAKDADSAAADRCMGPNIASRPSNESPAG